MHGSRTLERSGKVSWSLKWVEQEMGNRDWTRRICELGNFSGYLAVRLQAAANP